MPKQRIYSLIGKIVFCIFFISCQNNTHNKRLLSRADALVCIDPDSALAVLTMNENNKLHFTSVDDYLQTDASLQNQEGYDNLKGLINYHIGLACYQQVDYKNSIEFQKKAFEYFKKTQNTKQEALALKEIGNNFGAMNLIDSSNYYYQSCMKLAELHNYNHLKFAVLHNMGRNSRLQLDYSKSILYSNKALTLSQTKQDSALCLLSLGATYLHINKLDSARHYLYLSKSLQNGKHLFFLINLYDKLVILEEQSNHLRMAFDYFKKRVYYSDSLSLKIRTHSIKTKIGEIKYNNAVTEKHIQKVEHKKIVVSLILLSSILLIYAFMLWKKYAQKKKQQEVSLQEMNLIKKELSEHKVRNETQEQIIDNINKKIARLDHALGSTKNEIKQYKQEIALLEKESNNQKELERLHLKLSSLENIEIERRADINLLSMTLKITTEQHIEYSLKLIRSIIRLNEVAKKESFDILKDIYLTTIGSETFNWTSLLNRLDTLFSGVFTRMKENYPSLSSNEYKVCCLMCAGFDNELIALTLEIEKKTAANIKWKLNTIFNLQNSKEIADQVMKM